VSSPSNSTIFVVARLKEKKDALAKLFFITDRLIPKISVGNFCTCAIALKNNFLMRSFILAAIVAK